MQARNRRIHGFPRPSLGVEKWQAGHLWIHGWPIARPSVDGLDPPSAPNTPAPPLVPIPPTPMWALRSEPMICSLISLGLDYEA